MSSWYTWDWLFFGDGVMRLDPKIQATQEDLHRARVCDDKSALCLSTEALKHKRSARYKTNNIYSSGASTQQYGQPLSSQNGKLRTRNEVLVSVNEIAKRKIFSPPN